SLRGDITQHSSKRMRKMLLDDSPMRRLRLFFFQAEDGIRDGHVTGVQTCALPISALAAGLVRAVGEAVAVVVADDAARAADGAAAVVVDYEPLALAATVDAAQATGAPRVFDEWPDNVAGLTQGDVGDDERGFSEAQEVVEVELAVPRVAPR